MEVGREECSVCIATFMDTSVFSLCLYSYFESGVCSVYLWDLDHGFAGVVLIKKAGDTEKIKGCWDSIHVVEVQVSPTGQPIGRFNGVCL